MYQDQIYLSQTFLDCGCWVAGWMNGWMDKTGTLELGCRWGQSPDLCNDTQSLGVFLGGFSDPWDQLWAKGKM